MAISKRFGGATIFIPGAYDTKNVILTGAAPSVAVGKVAIIGESTKGEAGKIMQFSPEALSDLIAIFGEGPIADAARVLVAPSNDARIAQGASAIYVYKTNPSTKAELALGSWGSAEALEFGDGGNLISLTLEKANAVLGSTASSVAFDETTIASGDKLVLRMNGGAANTWTASGIPADNADLAAQLANAANWSAGLPAEATISVSGTDGASIVTISIQALSTDHQLGKARMLELAAGSPDALAKMELSEGVTSNTTEPSLRVVSAKSIDGISEDSDNSTGNVGGKVVMKVGYEGTTATVTINSTSIQMTVAGGAGTSMTILKSQHRSISALAEFINSKPGFSASIPSGVNGSLSPADLDRVTAAGMATSDGSAALGLKADASSLAKYADQNSVLISLVPTSSCGLPDAIALSFLAGAERGASATSDFLSGLEALEGIDDCDLVIPLASQDASDDLAEDSSSTDLSSTYEVASIHAATRNHCKSMSSTKNRKERQCYLGMRGTFEEAKTQSLALSSEFCSLLIQDIQVAGSDGNLVFKQPHIAAALCAGLQAGADIGQPTTKKRIAAQAIRHVKKQGLTPSILEKFDPRKKADQAIEANIMPLEQLSTGGVRIIVQNSTYSKDNNFVWNRPSVISCMNFIAKVMRTSIDDKFVGEKNRTTTPQAIKADIEGLMADMLKSDIIVGDDTNGGLGYKNLVIRAEGNTVFVDITVTPVQGVDFVFTNIAIDNIRILVA